MMIKASDGKKAAWITFFVLPGAAVVFVFILLPLFMSLFNSLFDWNQLIRGEFVGLENFHKLFNGYPYRQRFINALGNNLKWFVVSMLVQNTLGLLFGYALSRRIAGRGVYIRILFIPVLFSLIAVGSLWGLYLKPKGMVNNLLILLGRPDLRRAWLGDGAIATYALIAVNIWRWVGFPTLVFMSAVDNVPEGCVEAAYLDGAGERRIFLKIVLPLIVPAIAIVSVLTVVGSLNVFEQVYTMAGLDGPPNYATDTIGTLFYRTAFGSVDSGAPEIGVGSAIAVVIYLMTFVISLISIRLAKSKEVEL